MEIGGEALDLAALFRFAECVIVPSSRGVALMRSLGIPADRVMLTPYVVDNDWWSERSAKVERATVRREWGVPEQAPVVLFCAKLQPWKRPQDLLRAFAVARVSGAHLCSPEKVRYVLSWKQKHARWG